MERIQNFIQPENLNNLYTNEARSAIQIMRELTARMNELIDTFNTLNTNDNAWKQTQEGKINGGIVYMKDHLINSLNDLMNGLLQSGFVDRRISANMTAYAQAVATLTAQLNNAISGLTVDSEIINGRVTYDNKTFATIGEAVRSQITEIYTALNDLFVTPLTANLLDPTKLINGEYVDVNGTFGQNARFCRTGFINISQNNGYVVALTYLITNPLAAGASFHRCAFYDVNKNFISGVNNGTTNGAITSGLIPVPDRAVYFACGYTVADNVTRMIAYSDTVNIPYEIYNAVRYTPSRAYRDIQLTSYHGKKLVCVGDSITAQNLWQPYILNRLGFSTVTNYGYSGQQSWQIIQHVNDWTDDADVILCMFGTNDWNMNNQTGNVSDTRNVYFAGNVYNFIKLMVEKYPTKQVIIVGCPYGMQPNKEGFTDDGRLNDLHLSTNDYSGIMKTVCAICGVPFIDLMRAGFNRFNITNFMQSDGGYIHPNINGAERIAEVITGELLTLKPFN